MYRLSAIFVLAFIVFSCNKRRTDATDFPQGYADSQVVGNWKITAISSDVANDWNGDGITEKDIYSTWTACQKDHLYTFSPDKSGTYQVNCSTTQLGSWEIVDTKFLQYACPALGVESERMISMTSIQFVTTKNYSLANGQPATVTKVWTRQ